MALQRGSSSPQEPATSCSTSTFASCACVLCMQPLLHLLLPICTRPHTIHTHSLLFTDSQFSLVCSFAPRCFASVSSTTACDAILRPFSISPLSALASSSLTVHTHPTRTSQRYETKLHHELLPRITPGGRLESDRASSPVGGGAHQITTLEDALRRIAQLEAELRVCRRAARLRATSTSSETGGLPELEQLQYSHVTTLSGVDVASRPLAVVSDV